MGILRYVRSKILRIMKLTVMFLLVTFLSVSASSLAQKTTIRVNNMSLKQVFKEIRQKMGYTFVFNEQIVSKEGKVSLNITSDDIREILDKCLENTSLDYYIQGDAIVILAREKRVQQETEKEATKITGHVVDKQGHPLPGVTVLVKGTSVGVVTDINGDYSIVLPEIKEPILVFSFIGMKSQEIKVTEKHKIDVVMEEDETELEEVVVTGYQTVSRRESASAISTIKAKDIMVQGVGSIDQMLQGRIPGMMVMTTSGEPSATPKIRIRGNATINGNKAPVWVVDGVILEQDVPFSASDINSEDAEYLIGNAISGLNPQDIESITVLKDASATAIYGVKAANGVIVITTKKGEVGAPRITYNGNVTINTRPSYSNYHRMNSQERVEFSKYLVESNMNFGRVPTGETYEAAYEEFMDKQISYEEFEQKVNRLQTRNTDWFDLLFRSDITHTHSLNVSGGSENVRYYVSAGYSNIEGAARGSDSEKYNALAKIDVDYNKYFSFMAKIDYSSTSNTGYSSAVNPFDYAYTTTRTMLPIMMTVLTT